MQVVGVRSWGQAPLDVGVRIEVAICAASFADKFQPLLDFLRSLKGRKRVEEVLPELMVWAVKTASAVEQRLARERS